MAKTCLNCGNKFQTKIEVEGRIRNFQRRKYCLTCSPFGSGNTRKLHVKKDPIKKRIRDNEKYKKWQQKARYERKRKLVDMLGGCCSKCGYKKCIQALDFHHKDSKNKSFSISEKGLCRKWQDLVDEVKKCIVLCRNCHAEEHYGIVGSNPTRPTLEANGVKAPEEYMDGFMQKSCRKPQR